MEEIERKFLVTSEDYKQDAHRSSKIIQGYLNRDPERTVRIRLKDTQAFITIKGKSNNTGTTRFEWEKEIDFEEGKQLLHLCEGYLIEKIRHEVNVGNHTFEVDEFLGDNDELVLAEIELDTEDQQFSKPAWLGSEVTGTIEYYNAQLSQFPFKKWLT